MEKDDRLYKRSIITFYSLFLFFLFFFGFLTSLLRSYETGLGFRRSLSCNFFVRSFNRRRGRITDNSLNWICFFVMLTIGFFFNSVIRQESIQKMYRVRLSI